LLDSLLQESFIIQDIWWWDLKQNEFEVV